MKKPAPKKTGVKRPVTKRDGPVTGPIPPPPSPPGPVPTKP